MDTRTKIVALEFAAAAARSCRAAGRLVTLVSGFFDPLLAAHARRLGEIAPRGGALFVALQDPPFPVLSAQARAELVAALGMVDYVILPGPLSPGLAETIPAEAVFSEGAADQRRTQEFIQRVHDRQK